MASNGDISLVVFDCDGVLVDSEMLSAGVLMELMAEVGLPITAEIFRNDFLGRSFASAAERAERRFGHKLPQGFQLNYRERLLKIMAQDLRAMEGVHIMLAALRCNYCLATGSSPQRLQTSLAVTGLTAKFERRSFTASEVVHSKPAPDLYFLAASRMGVEPGACLVIEDSEMGVRAAKAAGMRVWHFAGGAHVKAGYRLPDDLVVDRVAGDMRELKNAFAEIGLC